MIVDLYVLCVCWACRVGVIMGWNCASIQKERLSRARCSLHDSFCFFFLHKHSFFSYNSRFSVPFCTLFPLLLAASKCTFYHIHFLSQYYGTLTNDIAMVTFMVGGNDRRLCVRVRRVEIELWYFCQHILVFIVSIVKILSGLIIHLYWIGTEHVRHWCEILHFFWVTILELCMDGVYPCCAKCWNGGGGVRQWYR